MPSTLSNPTDTKMSMVGMGQIQLATESNSIGSVLGSCIGIVLYHPRYSTCVFAHIVLAESSGRSGPPGKYSDTAIPAMVKMLIDHRIPPAGLSAKIAGGAQMFGGTGPLQVGQANADAVRLALKNADIHLVAEHVGGAKGRRVSFDCRSKKYTVEIVGVEATVL